MILEQDLQNTRRQNNDHGQVSAEVKCGVRSPKFIWAPCAHWLKPRNLFFFKYKKNRFQREVLLYVHDVRYQKLGRAL
jgi:hypothetical protein